MFEPFFNRHDCWAGYQHRSLAQVLSNFGSGTKVSPLFEGSMLFNQLEIHAPGLQPVDVPVLESLDSIYQSRTPHGEITENQINLVCGALLVDAQEASGNAVVLGHIGKLLSCANESGSPIERIVLLGKKNRSLLREIRVRSKTKDMNSVYCNIKAGSITPRWYSPAALLRLYALARHTLFLNSYRVLDAAAAGNSVSFLMTRSVGSLFATTMAIKYLQSANCPGAAHEWFEVSIPEEFVDRRMADTQHGVAENNIASLKSALVAGTDCRSVECDVAVIGNSPVWIVAKQAAFVRKLISWRRKMAKLGEDPRAFLADSRFNGLQTLERLIPASMLR